MVGRKRHIAVDTAGHLLMVNLTTADIADSTGAQAILDAVRKRRPWINHLFADGGTYDRTKLLDKAAFLDFVIEIIRRIDAEPGFKVLPRRWGRGAHLRLVGPLAAVGPRLRAASGRLRGYDPRRDGRPLPATHGPPVNILKQTLTHP